MINSCSVTKCLKNQPCDVIKMKKMRGEEGKKPLKKRLWLIFETLCPPPVKTKILRDKYRTKIKLIQLFIIA